MNPTYTNTDPQTAGAQLTKSVVPLLGQLSRLEDLTNALAVRLDAITVHEPTSTASANQPSQTVTARLTALGDTLQYLLDHIEL